MEERWRVFLQNLVQVCSHNLVIPFKNSFFKENLMYDVFLFHPFHIWYGKVDLLLISIMIISFFIYKSNTFFLMKQYLTEDKNKTWMLLKCDLYVIKFDVYITNTHVRCYIMHLDNMNL